MPLVLVVPQTSKVRTVQDLVAQGKTQPLNFGSAGSASAQQLAGESFKVRTGLRAAGAGGAADVQGADRAGPGGAGQDPAAELRFG
ncbi:hypothetical protein CTI14_66415, partial [Methylobacterium radiotolerans]